MQTFLNDISVYLERRVIKKEEKEREGKAEKKRVSIYRFVPHMVITAKVGPEQSMELRTPCKASCGWQAATYLGHLLISSWVH